MKQWTQEALTRHFGKTGKFFYNIVRGVDNRPVQPNRQTKSISVEDTFAQDIADLQVLEDILKELSGRLAKRLNAKQLAGKTVTLKVKFSDFSQATRSMTSLEVVTGEEVLYQIASELLNKVSLAEMKVRLLGVGVSNFTGEDPDQQINRQLTLF